MKSEETKLQGEKSGSGAIDQVCSWFTCKAMAFILSRNVPEKGRESSTTVDEIDVHSFNSLRNLIINNNSSELPGDILVMF